MLVLCHVEDLIRPFLCLLKAMEEGDMDALLTGLSSLKAPEHPYFREKAMELVDGWMEYGQDGAEAGVASAVKFIFKR